MAGTPLVGAGGRGSASDGGMGENRRGGSERGGDPAWASEQWVWRRRLTLAPATGTVPTRRGPPRHRATRRRWMGRPGPLIPTAGSTCAALRDWRYGVRPAAPHTSTRPRQTSAGEPLKVALRLPTSRQFASRQLVSRLRDPAVLNSGPLIPGRELSRPSAPLPDDRPD